MTAPLETAPPSSFTPLSRGRGAYALGLLLFIYVLNFIDRQIMGILAEPMKNELHLADWQIGAMSGLAFTLLYTFLGLPMARLAERTNRPVLIALAVTTWSLFTMVCGVAQSFLHLIIARVGVGVGEAGCTPTSMSLISDYVSRERRAAAMSVYTAGGSIGSLLGLTVGGVVADAWGWRAAFLVVGVPGILAGLLAALTLKEPRKQQSAGPPAKVESLGVVMKHLARNRTYKLVVAGETLQAIMQYAQSAFMGAFFLRIHGAELASIGATVGLKEIGLLGMALGLSLGVGGISGSVVASVVVGRWQKTEPRAPIMLSGILMLIGTPLAFLWLLSPTLWGSLACFAMMNFCYVGAAGPANAVIQGLVPATMRATAVAIMLFLFGLLGMGVGPLLVGLASDAFSAAGFGVAEGLRAALLVTSFIGLPVVACYWMARTSLLRDTCS